VYFDQPGKVNTVPTLTEAARRGQELGLDEIVFAILDVALLRLRLRKGCGFGLNQILPFPNGHESYLK